MLTIVPDRKKNTKKVFLFGICFSNFRLRAKPNKEEKKNKIRKIYIVLYFQIVLFFLNVSIFPRHHTSFVHQQRTEGGECMYPYLNKQGKGSPGDTKMVALYVLFSTLKKSAI